MTTVNEFLLILGMTLVTFGVRYPTLALVGKVPMPPAVIRALRYVPVAVLTAIIATEVFYRDGVLTFNPTNPYFIAALVAIGVSWRTKNLLLTIVLGMVGFFAWRALLGV